MSFSPKNKLLTTTDVLAFLPVSRPTLLRLVQSKQLPCIRVGRRVLFRPEDLRAFLEARHVK